MYEYEEEWEELNDPVRLKIAKEDEIYLDVGIKALYALQIHTGVYEELAVGEYVITIAIVKGRSYG